MCEAMNSEPVPRMGGGLEQCYPNTPAVSRQATHVCCARQPGSARWSNWRSRGRPAAPEPVQSDRDDDALATRSRRAGRYCSRSALVCLTATLWPARCATRVWTHCPRPARQVLVAASNQLKARRPLQYWQVPGTPTDDVRWPVPFRCRGAKRAFSRSRESPTWR
jgi:hypothetical protein